MDEQDRLTEQVYAKVKPVLDDLGIELFAKDDYRLMRVNQDKRESPIRVRLVKHLNPLKGATCKYVSLCCAEKEGGRRVLVEVYLVGEDPGFASLKECSIVRLAAFVHYSSKPLWDEATDFTGSFEQTDRSRAVSTSEPCSQSDESNESKLCVA